MFTNQIYNVILIVITTLICSSILMPIMIKIANHIGAIDMPRTTEGNRHIHKKATPKMGAVGIFISFLIGYMIFGTHSIQMNAILIGSFIIVLTGIIDDVHEIKAKYKFCGQLLAACIIAFYGNITLSEITAFGFYIDFGLFAYPLTILFIVACANIINLIDGLDGLSGGICSIFFLTIGIIGLYQHQANQLALVLAFIMLGSTLGFLIFNFNPAKIFAGDCTQFMGFIIAVISLLGFKGPALTSFFVPVILLGIPILDTSFAIIRRLLKKKPIFSPDKQHLHHQLLGMNLSPKSTVLIIYGINILFALASIFYILKDRVAGIIVYIILFIIVLWLVLTTSIISENEPKKIEIIKGKLKNKFKSKKTND